MQRFRINVVNSLFQALKFQAFRWWGASEKSGRGRKIDEGKNRAAPVSPRFFPLVFCFCARHYLNAWNRLRCQGKSGDLYRGSYRVLNSWKSFEICLSNFPDLEKVWKMKIKFGKMVKCLNIFLFVLKATASALEVRCFSCWSNLIQSRLNPNPNPNPKTAFFKIR